MSLDDLWEGWKRREIVPGDQVCRVGAKSWRRPESVLWWKIWKPRLIGWGVVFGVASILIAWAMRDIREHFRQRAEYQARPEVIAMRREELAKEEATERMRQKLNQRDRVNESVLPGAWDGAVPIAKTFIRAAVRDPSSLKFNTWSNKTFGSILKSQVDFTATNGFGGPVRERWSFTINQEAGKIVSVANLTTGEVIWAGE